MTKTLFTALLFSVALCAQETVLEMDPARTKVEFTLGDVLHTVHGTFALKRGSIRFDPATGQAGGEMVVDATSGASGSSARDRRMHKEILESARFLEIVFRPTHVEGRLEAEGASQVHVRGIFSIHGADHEIVLPAEVDAAGGEYKLFAHFDVPYVKWGMKNPSTFILRVNDRVEIAIHTVARPRREFTER
ncbi:MAG TPA: YceI family protein [Bryobacteraceae bacterium]|nr:YceI family protein [Bryobacteraceae bacterium]